MFVTLLKTERLHDGRRKLTSELIWYDGVIRVVVPAGTVTDFSSVPRFARSFMPRWSEIDLAGTLHDYLYQQGYDRFLADAVWFTIVRQGTGRRVASKLGWLALRLFGRAAYRRHRKRETA